MHKVAPIWEYSKRMEKNRRPLALSLLSVFTEPRKLKAHINDPEAREDLRVRLSELFREAYHRPILVLCIGTDRSTGDALGPLIGTQLLRQNIPQLHVWGTLDDPVHATNLEEHIQRIHNVLANPYILAIDACLGRLDSVGCITLAEGPLKPGAGVNKQLPEVGHIHLTGIVNVGGFMEYMVLQNTRLNLVWNMAEAISDLIAQSFWRSRL